MTENELQDAREVAELLDLSGRELLDDTAAALAECNGVGAEWMGFVAGVISKLHPSCVIAAHIHDLRYYYGGTETDRLRADAEFLANCVILAYAAYKWYDPRRYAALLCAVKFFFIVRSGGEFSWKGSAHDDV